jgi:hypothetical protein
MRISLAIGPRVPLSRQTAWGCLTTNIAMPGFGSLAAGHRCGYVQAALGLAGLAITLVSMVPFFTWYVANWSLFYGANADPTSVLGELWLRMRWPLVGFAVFGVGWLWALATSLQILREAGRVLPPSVPPILRTSGRIRSGPPPRL